MDFRFFHFSDTHLEFYDLDMLNQTDKTNIREEDVYSAFREVIDYAIDNKIDFLIHSGDIFHRSSPSNRALVFLTEQLNRLEESKIPIYIIAGNHDFPKSIFTTPIHHLYQNYKYVKVFFDESYTIYETEFANLHLLPHINSEIKYNDEISKLAPINNGKPNIFTTHVSMPSYLLNETGERVFPEKALDILKDFDYTALGHWHRYNHFSKYGNVYYSGSTERFSDKEVGYDKVFLECSFNGTITVTPHKLNSRLKINIQIEDCASKDKIQIIKEIEEALKNISVIGGIFNIKLNDMTSTQVYEIAKEDFEKLLEGALAFFVSKTIKGSDEVISLDSQSFDLRGHLNEELRKNFIEDKEFETVSKLVKELFDKIEEEELDADK